MEADRFDDLARRVHGQSGRRAALKAAGGALRLLGLGGLAEEALGKSCKKKKDCPKGKKCKNKKDGKGRCK